MKTKILTIYTITSTFTEWRTIQACFEAFTVSSASLPVHHLQCKSSELTLEACGQVTHIGFHIPFNLFQPHSAGQYSVRPQTSAWSQICTARWTARLICWTSALWVGGIDSIEHALRANSFLRQTFRDVASFMRSYKRMTKRSNLHIATSPSLVGPERSSKKH